MQKRWLQLFLIYVQGVHVLLAVAIQWECSAAAHSADLAC